MDLRMDTLLEGAAEWTGCCVVGAGTRRGGRAAEKGDSVIASSSEPQLDTRGLSGLVRRTSGGPLRPTPVASISALKAPAPTSSPKKPKPSEEDPSKKQGFVRTDSSTRQEKRGPKPSNSLRRRSSTTRTLVREDSTLSRSSATDNNERKFNWELDVAIERRLQQRMGLI